MSTTTPGNAESQLGAKTPAPTVRPIPAQGIALGPCGKRFQALKGRPKTACRDIAPAREFLFPSTFMLTKTMVQLAAAGIARELTCQRRNRVFSYDAYLSILNEGGETL
ncbi:MAG: hypothetical protein RLZZ245_2848 [Verrucomicrobiota bacterium]|jgi:hypothetical protein